MDTLAATPPYEPTPRKGRPASTATALQPQLGEGEFKENVLVRKPLPHIPLPPSGRIQGVPMSPVTLNVQSEDWSSRQSSAYFDNVSQHVRQVSMEVGASDYRSVAASGNANGHQQRNSDDARAYDLPIRQQHIIQPAQSFPESQSEMIVKIGSGVASVTKLESLTAGELGTQPANPSTPDSEEAPEEVPEVPSFEYLHLQRDAEDIGMRGAEHQKQRLGNNPLGGNGNAEAGGSIGRNLTPIIPRSMTARPASAYSDLGARGGSPATFQSLNSGRTASANSARTSEGRPSSSYIDLLNVPYPQPPPVPFASFDNSLLRSAVGTNASLLSSQKTLEMYRLNVKKTNDPSIQYAFAVFLITAAQETAAAGSEVESNSRSDDSVKSLSSAADLLREARQILGRLSDRSYPFAQYYLGDGFASGLFNKGKEDYDRAFPLFVAASKHGHAESGYRAALCYEFGWGCRIDAQKAVQFYRQSASKNHPGAMTRLGLACLQGDLGLNKYREGLKWLKRATESADTQYNASPYHLGRLYETGYGDDLFQDESYAAELFTQAADLGHSEASYRMGDAYEHGKLCCPQDPALSVHFYTCAAQAGHPAAMMALCAWYMVGAEPVLEKDENEAYEWARRAAECGLRKAEYAVGYFTEMGIGCRRDPLEANVWYVRAADSGDERAKIRLAAIRAAASGGSIVGAAKVKDTVVKTRKDASTKAAAGAVAAKDEKECVVM